LDPLIPRDQIFEEEVNEAPLNFIRKEKPADSGPRLNDDMVNGDTGNGGKAGDLEDKLNTSWELIDSPFLRPPKQLKKKISA